MDVIKFENVCAGYGNEEVLHHLNLEFETGKITVIVGPNGCGKSTLLKSLVRLNPHTTGDIFVDGLKIENYDSTSLAQKIAYLPQGKKVPDITVKRMVLHGRFAYLNYPRRYRKQDYEMAEKAMRWVGIESLADKNLNQLSGGMQQKVYIAMALAQDTPVILMDEPTTYLDIAYQLKLMDLAKKLADSGKAVVMILHDLTQALRYADEIIVMADGQILESGTPEEIYEKNIIDSTFRIQLSRVLTETGYRYFVSEPKEDEEAI